VSFLNDLTGLYTAKMEKLGNKEMQKRGIKIVVLVFSILLNFVVKNCYCDDIQYQDAKTSTLLWRTPVYAIASRYLSVALHEGGHVLVGRAFGRNIADFYVGLDGGYTDFDIDEQEDRWKDALISFSGPLTDRLVSIGVNKYLDAYEYNMSEYFRSFLATTYLWGRINFAGYIFLTNIDFLLDSYSSDWYWITRDITNSNEWYLDYGVVTLFTVFAVLDIIYSWDEIKKNYNRMIGKYSARREPQNTSKIEMQFLNTKATREGFAVEQSFRF
jgi:hypothetical protein